MKDSRKGLLAVAVPAIAVLVGCAIPEEPSATAGQPTNQASAIANRLAACNSAEDRLGGILRTATHADDFVYEDWTLLAAGVHSIETQSCDGLAPSFPEAVDEAARSMQLAADQGLDRAIEAMQIAEHYLEAAVQESRSVPAS